MSILQGGFHSFGGTILQIPYLSASSRILKNEIFGVMKREIDCESKRESVREIEIEIEIERERKRERETERQKEREREREKER